jgi:hypothetical protein
MIVHVQVLLVSTVAAHALSLHQWFDVQKVLAFLQRALVDNQPSAYTLLPCGKYCYVRQGSLVPQPSKS